MNTTSAFNIGAKLKKSPTINSILFATPYISALCFANFILYGSISIAITKQKLFVNENQQFFLKIITKLAR